MNKNFQKIEKDLRSIAKRYKSVKYSIGLVILFLMMGLNAFSEEVNTGSNVSNSVGTIATREGIRDSVEDLQGKIKDVKAQNTKSIESLRLELIQLMEQGGQVIKSPWASWQFGINYVYNSMSGMYKGRGDKPPKYVYNSIYRRGNWEERNALDVLAGKTVNGGPITPGNENTNTWQITNGLLGGANLKRDLSIDASTNGGREWGLVDLRKIREPLNEIEILARVSPKEVKKDKLDIPVSVTPPATLSAPVVNPNVNKPTEAPKVDLPTQPNLEIAQAPAINNDPEIKVLTVNKVGAITIDIPIVKPVDFILSAAELSTDASGRKFLNKPYSLNGQTIAVTQTYAPHPGDKKTGNYISTWGYVKNLGAIDTIVNVDVEDTRAFMVDEGIDVKNTKYDPFKYTGTINLNKSKNVGIDVQGTHTSYSSGAQVNLDSDITSGDTSYSKGTTYTNINTVANITVTNAGKIIGNGGTGIENQVAFGFNNFDASSNNTRTEMINEGTITLNAIKSVGIQLRPEDPNASGSRNDLGLNMMTGENKGDDATITLNGAGSFGILTVKNKKSNGTLAARKTYSNYGVTTSEGGQIASRAQEDYKSLVKNTGKIKIESDNSIGVGILNSIQSVEVGGTIDIGKGTLGTYGDITGGVSGKVDGAVGVYTEEATRPVKGRVYTYTTDANGVTTETMTKGGKDDHGLENTIAIETGETYTDSTGATKNKYRGQQVGTDTVEVSGTINLENNSTKSFGLRNSKTGSITLLGGGKVEVKGEKNFGALSNASAGKIDINHGAEIKGTGKESIGYAMLDGVGTNDGTIDVTGNNTPTPGATTYEGSLGFYGEKGTFNNVGTIKTKGNLAHAVVVKNPGMTFNHYGTIEVDSHAGTATDPGIPGNIGVFSDGDATVNFKDNSNVFVGKNSIGIYSEDKTKFNSTFKNHGTLNIKIDENSTFAYLNGNATTSLEKFFVKNADGKDVTVNIKEEMGENSSLVYADGGAKALLDGNYTITKGNVNPSTMALLAANASNVTVDSGKTLTTNTQVALAAVSGSTAENKGTIVSNRSDKGIGIYAKEAGSKGINKGTITMEEINAIGMYGKDVASLESSTGSNIKVKKTGSVGMYGVVSASATVPPFTVTNAGTIELEEGGSAGIYLVNKSTATDKIANLSASNTGTGTIKLKSGEGSIGIYAPKATISNVGTIEIANTATKSIAAYISDGGKITNASTANINLGTSGKNIAYYVKNAGTSIGGANVGTVKGYGVGVYLEGTKANPTATPAVSASQATLEANAPELKFNNGTTDGNGIIGLYLKGNTKISDYTKTITVGNTVGTNSAIGIYSDAQGVSGTPYVIKANITTGAKAVGIFSAPDKTAPVVANKSYIKYLGSQMNLGEGSTGFYVNGKTELDTTTTTTPTTTINLDGGLVAYVTENSEFVGGNSKVNLSKPGIGVYGERGAKVDVGSWTFNNNGNAAEEVRLKEGQAKVTTNKDLKPKMVLTHVINGETYLASGQTVKSIADPLHPTTIEQEENIGLIAEGIKDTSGTAPVTWTYPDYELVNSGTINFESSKKSTAIYVNSARAKNNGTIKVGKYSTAIYGIYKDKYYEIENGTPVLKQTEKYKGAPTTPDPNKLVVHTSSSSNISLDQNSTGMYLVNAEEVKNDANSQITSTTGSTDNVGIYAINGKINDSNYDLAGNYKKLTMTTATNITLGEASVGIYTRGKDSAVTDRNIVKNDGNIIVGDTRVENRGLPNEKRYPAVGIYAENTKLTQGDTGTPNITVGKEGIALYGKNSSIEAKGTVNYSNKGVLAYLDNSTFISHYGNLTAHQNTMLFLINSIANMNGAGADIDITVPDKAITSDSFAGVYVEGNSELNGVKKIEIGKNSNGIFMKNANFTSNVTDIVSTKEGAKGLLAENSNLTTNSKITLSGKNSIGIYAKNTSASSKNIINTGKLDLSGEQTLGAFLVGKQNFENKANINIADSADAKKPTIGIYTATTVEKDGAGNVIATYEGSDIKHSTGTIEVGEKSIGIYSKTSSNVEMTGGKVHVKDQGIGIYKEGGKLTVNGELDIDKHVATTKDSEPVGVYAVNGTEVVDQASKITVGERSYGFILNNTDPNKTNVYTNTNAGPVSLGNDSVFLYSNGKANITNNRTINSNNSDHLIGFYVKNGGELLNNGIIDFSTGKGNIGIYAPAGKATNKGKIFVGPTDDIDPATGKAYSDPTKIVYGIGMAADNGGHIINEGDIKISNNKSIGMYGAGVGTTVENKGNILLDGSKATATDKIGSMTGVYVDEGATFKNTGTITTTDSYAGRNGKINDNVAGLVGVAVMNGSTLINEATGKIYIDADNSTGVIIRGKRDANGNLIRRAVIKNYGEIKVRGTGGTTISWKDLTPADIAELQRQINAHLISTDPKGHELGEASGTDKDYQGVTITVKNGQATFLRNGVPVSDSEVEKINKLIGNQPNLAMSDVGFYVDTLGRTRPVTFDGVTPPVNSQLIIGTEYSERTNKKEWLVSGEVIKPFLDQIQGRNYKITSMAGSLTWIATPVLDNYGQIVGVAMSKLSYTSFVKPEDNAYNFTDGLEQRYGMNGIDTPEKRLFNKLNSIGKNEETLLTQAYDEMMGHQYANTQQRIQATGKVLDKEFSYLRNSWSNPSKDSNKIKTFGMSGEYKTDTAGIIDYKNNAYGVAYVHEDESVRLGEGTGWYAGIVHNTFKFKDIGNSKEEQLQGKVGLFKSIPFDYNNSLNWTVSGDVFVGYNKMHRKFLVVDEVFNAKSRYNTYGVGIRNEVGKEFRLNEGLSVRPYGALKVEYGRVSKIKEKSGEVKLEVKSNDYLSVKPEIGAELAYKLFLGNKALRAAVTVAYENELGRVANGKNKARVAGTTADYFNIRGEKEDRRGNVKTDLNIGIDNQKVGVTGNIGYDTKGKNIRGGLGLRVIF